MFPKHDQKPDVRHHKEWGQASLSIDRLIWYKKKWYKESSKPTDYIELQCFLRSDTCTPWPNALMIDSKNNDMLVNLYFLLDHNTHCGSFKLGNLWRDKSHKNVRLCRLCSAPTIWASNWFCILGSLTPGSPPPDQAKYQQTRGLLLLFTTPIISLLHSSRNFIIQNLAVQYYQTLCCAIFSKLAVHLQTP